MAGIQQQQCGEGGYQLFMPKRRFKTCSVISVNANVVMCKCGLHPGSPIQTSTDGIAGCSLVMTEDESVDSVRVETQLELLYLMTEDEYVDCRYKLVNSNVAIKECVTSVRVETQLRKERETHSSKRT